MGHSLGNNICVAMINSEKNKNNFKNLFCVEGQIFFHRSLNIFNEIDKSIYEMNNVNIISLLYFYRDIYVQYFLRRIMTIDKCFIYKNSNVNIKLYFSDDEKLIKNNDQINYAERKGIKICYDKFNNKSEHGAFIFNSYMREKILEDIKNYY